MLESVRVAASRTEGPLLLAVSGGMDSMALLHAMTSVAPERIAAVATFDHGTGEAASRAAELVVREARRRGLPLEVGVLASPGRGPDGLEAMWRTERYRFLREAAARLGARVVTAHTEDDQVETVLMRVLRGSGARGLAALAAPSDVVRPFLDVRRSALEAYVRREGVAWMEDPSNLSPAFLRNRLRREILPALRRADPTLDAALLETGRAAAALRADVERFVDRRVMPRRVDESTLVVATMELAGYDRDSVAVLWGALAGRVGLALDRSGTRRCAAFTMKRPRTGRIPLSGGWNLEARRQELVLRRDSATAAGLSLLPADGTLEWGQFRFSVATSSAGEDGWSAALPSTEAARVRCWQPGDRLGPAGGSGRRRVKRYLSDAGLSGSDRARWPVVILGDEVVWIPGVRRSDAATARPGGPARYYICERTHG
ncbi:MAG: tRNA(Ile)-lysidine synthase [Gemmatimonadetes bacterium]|nr:tRNA(Ile)-lysidine synthase [Gemmatimonadota bacterium]